MKFLRMIRDMIVNKIDVFNRLDGIFVNNPVLIGGLALTPIIVVANTLKSAVFLTIVITCMYIPVILFARYFGHKIKPYIRELSFVIISSVVFIFASRLIDLIDGLQADKMGIYLPILVVDALIVVKANEISGSKESFIDVLRKIVYTLIGFAVVAVILGTLREVLAYGTLWDIKIVDATVPSMTTAYMGFLLVGLIAALNQQISKVIKKELNIKSNREDK